MWLDGEKCLVAVALFGVTLFLAFLPKLLVKRLSEGPGWRNVISFLTCFSGGVFLAVGLVDILPDVREQFDLHAKQGQFDPSLPWAEITFCIGVIAVLTMEQVALKLKLSSIPTNENTPLVHDDVTFGAEDGHRHDHDHENSRLRSWILVVALTFHSVFEGLALGLQTSTKSLLAILAAVLIHKGIMAFGVGLNSSRAGIDKLKFFGSIATFSAASPLGVFIGVLVSSGSGNGTGIGGANPTRALAGTVLQGLAGGTFLYVLFWEILPQEFLIPKLRLSKLFFVYVGFAVSVALIVAAP